MGLVREVSQFSFNDLKVRPRVIKFLDVFVTPETFLAIMRLRERRALIDLGLNFFINGINGTVDGSPVHGMDTETLIGVARMGKATAVQQLEKTLECDNDDDVVKILHNALVGARFVDEDYEILNQQYERIKELFRLRVDDTDYYDDVFFVNGSMWHGGSYTTKPLSALHEKYEKNRFTSTKCEEAMRFLNEILTEKAFRRADWFIMKGEVCDEQQYYDIVQPLKDFLSNNKEFTEKMRQILAV